MAEPKKIALCADDFSLSYGVSVGILEALKARRLTATSALVTGPRWPAMGRELLRADKNAELDADIGLHFNLTLGAPLGSMPQFAPDDKFPKVEAVIKAALRSALPLEEIRAEIDRQFDRFEAVMERRPDFVDGHQHVQALPGIRGALFDAMEARGLKGRAWLRDSGDGWFRILFRGRETKKALAVRALASGFRREAIRRGFTVNDGFSGYSDFNVKQDYAALFATFLRMTGRRHLIMCHPGHVDQDLRELDPVTDTREQELAFLLSPRFEAMLASRGLRLARLSS
jgi:chitin disaccharide deacetylase